MIERKKKEITKKLISTFLKAGNISLELRKKGLKKEIKFDNTPVTNGDIEVNNLITKSKTNIPPKYPNAKLAPEDFPRFFSDETVLSKAL